MLAKSRERLPKHAIAENFAGRVLKLAAPDLSDEHFTVDGTRIEAGARQKSFSARTAPIMGMVRTSTGHSGRTTQQSTTDPDAKLYRKRSKAESKLSYLGHTLGSDTAGASTREDEEILAEMAQTVGVSRSPVIREAVQASAEQLKSLREKRWDTIEILTLPSLATLSGT